MTKKVSNAAIAIKKQWPPPLPTSFAPGRVLSLPSLTCCTAACWRQTQIMCWCPYNAAVLLLSLLAVLQHCQCYGYCCMLFVHPHCYRLIIASFHWFFSFLLLSAHSCECCQHCSYCCHFCKLHCNLADTTATAVVLGIVIGWLFFFKIHY